MKPAMIPAPPPPPYPGVLNWWRCPIHKGLWRPGYACVLCVEEEMRDRETKDAVVKNTRKASRLRLEP